MKVLYISSLSPLKGPGSIAIDHYKAMLAAGYKVDFLTQFPVAGYPEIKYVEKKENFWYRIKLQRNIFFRRFLNQKELLGRDLFYRKETNVHYRSRKILSMIDDDYDVVMIYFTQRLLTFKTIRDIVEHCVKRPKVVFFNPDYFTMTAGCHFVGSCVNYKDGCRNCPILPRPGADNFLTWNADYRKKFYEDFNPVMRVNQHMLPQYEQSSIIGNATHLKKSVMILDLDKFKPFDKAAMRKKYGIGDKYEFVMLFGCQELSNKRKGMAYLAEALEYLYGRMTETQREKVLVMSIGKKSDELSARIPFAQMNLGYVELEALPEIYSMADVFLSPSIDDAGPSMVNQSIACATPVVAFDMGTALEVIKDRGTGLCVPVRDSVGFADAISAICSMSAEEYGVMADRCRQVAEDVHSYDAFIKNLESQLAEA